ncbi:MAG: VCBS domain-containing protein, partial [Rhodoplanes sp.]
MLYGAGAEPGEYDFERDAAEPSCGQPRRAIGNIHTIVGSFTVARAGATLVHLEVGDPVFAGDEVETGADSTVGIHFSDGAVFELSACARMVLSEFACDGASSSSALFVLSKGAIAFMAGKAAKGGLAIDTPIARIRGSRGGGIVSLAVAALTFAALEAVRADDQPVIDDGRVELPHGTFELVTKEQVPQVIVVDDPWKTVVLQKVGSTVDVNQVTNSFERMDELGEVSRDTFAIFRDGQRDLFIQHQQHASLGSSETISDFSRPGISTVSLVSPTNLINSDFSPADRVATIPVAVAAASVPEVAATIVDSPTISPITSPTPAITLVAVAEQTFIDTSALDLFSPVNGALSATAANNATLTYGIAGGTADNSLGGYNQSLTDAYGTLYLSSTTGAYTFIPNDTAINALTAPRAANFTLTVSNGTVSAQETITFALNGANDAPTLLPVTGPTYPDDVESNGFSALAASNPFAPVTGTLIGADVDLPAQTLTYGIVDGTTGGNTDEVTYDVSKTGAYGTLYVNSATGDYEFVPNEAAIKALPATMATDTFTFTVSDGSLSAEQTFTVTINGVNDAPTLQPVAGPTYTDMSTSNDFAAATGTLIGADVDLPTQTLTYGIVGGSTVLDEVTYDVSKTGAYGTLYVNSATGDYTFVPNDAAIKALPAVSTTEEFTVTVSDGSLSAERAFTVTINGVNDGVTITGIGATGGDKTVYEANLTDGSSPNAAALTQTGTFNVSAPDGFADLTIGGVPVVTSGVVTIPPSAIATTYGALTITNVDLGTGVVSYSYTLSDNTLAHAPEGGANFVLDNISVALTDTDVSSASDTLIVKVVDDVPLAASNTREVAVSTPQTVDIQFIVDCSGSMFGGGIGDVIVPGDYSDDRIGLARYSMEQLLLSNDQIQNVQIIHFGTDAEGSAWMTKTDALDYIRYNNDHQWDSRGGTNYDAALEKAIADYSGARPSLDSDQNLVYFISDGMPAGGGITGTTPTPAEDGVVSIADWESHITTQGIDQVFAIGIGSGVSPANLAPIAYPNTDVAPPLGIEDNVSIVDTSNVTSLLNQLEDALNIPNAIAGNILLNDPNMSTGADSFGADGGRIQSITIDSVTYTYDPVRNDISASTDTQPPQDTPVLTLTTALGGTFTFYFAQSGSTAAGAWTYLTGASGAEDITYVLVDNDGDTAGSTLHFSVADTQHPAGIAGEPINLALSDPSDQATAINVTVSDLPSGWTLNEGTHLDDGSWTVQTTDVKSLTVTSSPDFVGAAVLNVTETWTNPDGTTGTKIIADNVEAYAPGSPIFAWSGDDTLTGSSDQDLFVFSQPIGQDVIYSFDASHDQIDLVGYAGITSFNDVASHLSTDANGDAVIALADGQSITLDGVTADSLSASNFVFDQTPVTNNAGAMTIGDGALLPLSGAIDNTGTIALDSAGHATTLELIQHGITLQGGGQLILSDSDANLISSAAPGVTFTNADNTISGAGQLGDWQMTLVNNGTIAATGAHALIIDTGSNVVINTGTLDSTGSGGLIVNSDVSNAGLLWAHGVDITVNGSVSGAGGALITGDATLEFAAAASINVTFVGADDFGT